MSSNRHNTIKNLCKKGSVADVMLVGGPDYYDNVCFSIACNYMNLPIMEFFLKTSKRKGVLPFVKIVNVFGDCCKNKAFNSAMWILMNFPKIKIQYLALNVVCLCENNQFDIMQYLFEKHISLSIILQDECMSKMFKNKCYNTIKVFYKKYGATLNDQLDNEYRNFIIADDFVNMKKCVSIVKYMPVLKCLEQCKKHFRYNMIEFLMNLNVGQVCRNKNDIVEFLIIHKKFDLASSCINKSPDFNRGMRLAMAIKYNCIDKLNVKQKLNHNLEKHSEDKLIMACIKIEARKNSAIWLIKNMIGPCDIDNIWRSVFRYKAVEILKVLIERGLYPSYNNQVQCFRYASLTGSPEMSKMVVSVKPTIINEVCKTLQDEKLYQFCVDKSNKQKKFNDEVLAIVLTIPIDKIISASMNETHNRPNSRLLNIIGPNIMDPISIDTATSPKKSLYECKDAKPFVPSPNSIAFNNDFNGNAFNKNIHSHESFTLLKPIL